MRAFGRVPTLAIIAVSFLIIGLTAAANHQAVDSDDIEFDWDSEETDTITAAQEPQSLLHRMRRGLFDWFSQSSTTQAPATTIEPIEDEFEGEEDTTDDSFRPNEETNDDEEGDSSGDYGRKPIIMPTQPGTEKTIRVTFVVMEPYVNDFSDHNSQPFQDLARSLNDNVNALYDHIAGDQRSNLVRIESRPSNEQTCKVTLDVVTVDNYDIEAIVKILKDRIDNYHRLGDITVSPDEFNYQLFNGPFLDPEIATTDSRLQCNQNEISCESGGCVPFGLRCNGNPDCPDGSDEKNCEDTNYPTEEQSQYTENEWPEPDSDQEMIQEKAVISTTLVPLTTSGLQCPSNEQLPCHDSGVYICNNQRCDGNNDCPGGEDEYGCGRQEEETIRVDDRYESEGPRRGDVPIENNEVSVEVGADEVTDGYSDEIDEPLYCGDQELTCDVTRCVPKSEVCDGHQDCEDNSDEINCTGNNCSGYFCDSGICLPRSARCNGVFECPGQDDEQGCPCRIDEYRCGDGACIESRRKCDNVRDCQDGSDEMGCRTEDVAKPWSGAYACARRHHFRCRSGECIPMRLRCDGYPNCRDKSDERKCPCRPDQWQCDSGECIGCFKRCNGVPDCRQDHSDEKYCTIAAAAHLFKCFDGTKISASLKCNRVYDCPDYSDERNCPCGTDDFKCSNGHCIPAYRRCDGTNDCQDRSDEQLCPERSCMLLEFACTSGECVRKTSRCDGVRDCPDGSDESHCPCGLDDFHCSNATCVDIALRCNGYPDCPNGEDEYNCGRACAHGDWKCSDGTCVKATSKCDGHRDCPDFSDERNCPALSKKCPPNEFPCNDGQCLPNIERCNGQPSCSDGEDEEGCKQTESCHFQCLSDGVCIQREDYCNGKPDCRDRSDEDNCIICPPGEFRCDNGVCIPSYLRCDRGNHCGDNSDEYDCENFNSTSRVPSSECSPSEFRCRSDGNCIQKEFVCDDNYDCNDNSDEENCGQNRICDYPNIYCDGVCHPQNIRCDGQTQCSDQQDEEDCNEIDESCPSDDFQCVDDDSCIPGKSVCDGVRDCKDGSDEDECFRTECLDSEFTCGDGNCIPHVRRCDNQYDCRDFSDEQKCFNSEDCREYEWRCTSGECVDNSYRCDGHVDCADGSDEASPPCPEPTTRRPTPTYTTTDSPFRPTYVPSPPLPQTTQRSSWNIPPGSESATRALQLHTYPSNQTVKTSGDVVFHCRDEGPLRAKVRWFKLGGPLPKNSTDVRGRLEMYNIAMSAAGTYICQAVGFRRDLPGVEVAVELNIEHYQPPEIRPAYACNINEATCSNGDCIPKSSICDGKFDCTDGIDEEACNLHSLCEPNEYRCANKRCVLRTWLCDSEDDCQDGSDELECRAPLPGEYCRPYEFQCKLNNQCIPKSFHCNGVGDCVDGSDELGCRGVQVVEPPPAVRILEQYDSLNISCRVVAVPTPEVVWRRNWGHIPEKCSSTNYKGFSTLICPNMQVEDSGAYSCEGLNIKGSIIATPDTIVQVKPKKTGAICDQGFFNSEARTAEECISCFCFGVTSECKSADLFVFQLPTLIGQAGQATRLVGVAAVPVKLVEVTEEPISDNFNIVLNIDTVTINRIGPWSSKNLHPYVVLPQDYNGNHLTSYGGYLRYRKNNPRAAPNRRDYTQLPDIILQGSGLQLIGNTRLSYNSQHSGKVEIRLFPQEWKRVTPYGPQKATREDLMVLLSNVSSILIRAEDDGNGLSISDLLMDSAGPTLTEIGASFVEECRCPEGYTGLSCQKCASGYTKEETNGVINRCVPQATVCEPGTYGDPQVGIPCKPCPCPHASATNQFARTCYLSQDGLPTCNCPSGYEGRRCELCSAGYVGNPTVSGDYCRPDVAPPSSRCDPRGTDGGFDDRCTCKPLATGERCDQCDRRAFYLSEENQNGCIECFCGGVSNSCDSSTLRRTTLRINFRPSSYVDYARVVVRPPNTLYVVETNITTEVRNNELHAVNFDRRSSEPHYWELPSSFTGNKLSAYGGFINYTIRHVATSGQNFPNNAPDLELVTETFGNLLYYDPKAPSYDGIKSGRVQLVEKYWQNIVGGPVPRQEFLTILSNLNYVLVKATYTTSTSRAALISASMDIAERDGRGDRAWLVEECRCPTGHVGLSCEKCSTGYTRGDGGLHFGNCIPCSCNGRSEQCHPETGDCYNCADNFSGKNCEECARGYYLIDGECAPISAQSNTYCTCDVAGSRNGCSDGECECKANVVGDRCNQCRPGTFNLQAWNLDGCKPCYCSGVSQTCRQAYGWRRDRIPTYIVPNEPHEFVLISWESKNVIRTGFQVNAVPNYISYELDNLSQDETYYWSLPTAFLGDKITSYGGNLTITQKFESPHDRFSMDGLDVILVGDQKTIFWSGIVRQPVNETFSYAVALREEYWNIVPGTGDLRPIAHYDFMGVLATLRQILVRATLSTSTRRTFISDIIMDTAIQNQNIGSEGNPASDVEVCTCPPGYLGTSCELCANLHYRDRQGQCSACPCQDNAKGCSLDGGGNVQCDCIPPHNGPTCKIIGRLIMELLSTGTTSSWRNVTFSCTYASPEPLTIQFSYDGKYVYPELNYSMSTRESDSWKGSLNWTVLLEVKRPDKVVECHAINRLGYTVGVLSRRAYSDGGNQDWISSPPPPERPRIVVTITNKVLDIQVGKSAHWRCRGRGYESNTPVIITWRREGGNMPYGRIQQDEQTGDLTIHNVEESDSGTYICDAYDGVAHATEKAVLTVSGNPPTPPEVRIDPTFIEVYEGEPIELACIATGNPAPKLSWIRADGRSIPPYGFQDGVFRIDSASVSDEGEYRCTAKNIEGSSYAVSVIYIKRRDSPAPGLPELTTSPSSLVLPQGGSGSIRCYSEQANIDSRLITWTRQNGVLPNTFSVYGDELRIVQAQPRDSGVYQCYVNDYISPASIMVTVQPVYDDTTSAPGDLPMVTVDKPTVTLAEGDSIIINCTASGDPFPTIRWRKVSGRLGQGAEQRGDSLVISNAKMSDADLYICEGLSYKGTPITQAPSYVTITRREKPSIRIWPENEMQIKIGEGAALQCTIMAGIPEPNVTWTRGDGMLFSPRTVLEPGNVIRIHNATVQDDAEYICTVRNEAGTATASTRVVIVANPVISIYPESYIVTRIGQEVNVECRVQGYPTPTVTWTRGSDHVGTEESYGALLHIPRVHSSDSGTYTCTAYNLAGTREEQIMIAVDEESSGGYFPGLESQPNQPPGGYIGATPLSYHAVEGGPAVLECSATPRDSRNNRPYEIDWVRPDGRPLSPTARINNNVLRIAKVSVEDAGDYQCRILVGGITEMVVTSTLLVDRLPTVTLWPERQIVQPGETVNLHCGATGDEPITLRWRPEFGDFTDRVKVRGSRGESLVFSQIEVQDAGGYVCEATNKVGTATATATVVVRETITEHHLTAASRTQLAQWGETVSLACDAEGKAASVHWYKEGGALPSKAKQSSIGVLTLTKVNPSDSGRYICRLEHDTGASTQDYVDLIVNGEQCSHPNKFKCLEAPGCVSEELLCDGHPDCDDFSDEDNCANRTKRLAHKRRTNRKENIDRKVLVTPPTSPPITGDNVTVDCRATSSDIDVNWYGPDSTYHNQKKYSGGSTLLLENVSPSQAGVFYCRGQDGERHEYSDIYSLVVQPAPSEIRNDQVLYAPLGSRILMPCITTLGGQLQYEWRRQGGYLPPTIQSTQQTLEIMKVSEHDAGAYICRVSNGRINMSSRVVLKVTNVVPQFNGDSYIALPTLKDVYQEFNIEVTIKPLHDNGLILYISERLGRDPGDMISLALVDGFPEFKFDTGNGPVTVRGDKRLELNQWHTVRMNRREKDGYMYVDGNGPFSGSSIGQYNMLNLIKLPLYIGGVPDYNQLSAEIINRSGYIGCISRLVLGDQEISLMSQKYTTRRNIENCDSCDPNPCSSGGICQNFLNERGHTCICAEGFSGLNCSRVGEMCTTRACGPGHCQESDQGIKCICPLGYVGERCEERRDIEYPGFSGGAYVAYQPTIPSRQLNVHLQVKPSSPLQDGIIMYASENRYGHGGFVALVVKDRHLEFRIDTGDEFAILRSTSSLRENVWTDILITRYLDLCKIIINGDLVDRHILKSRSKAMKLTTPMYVGGFDEDSVTINNKTEVFVGFNGCVKDVNVQGKALDIVKSSIKAANVQECNMSNQPPHRGDIPVITSAPEPEYVNSDCSRCVHGHCRAQSTSCTCDDGYQGRLCDETRRNLYQVAQQRCATYPCGDGGVCEPTNEGTYRCNCHLGYSGFHCQTPLVIREDFQLNGNAYVELPASLLNRKPELIALAFKSQLDDGVLLYQGGDSVSEPQDFVLLTIEQGLVKLEWDLGSGVGKLIHDTLVSDGRRHELVMIRQGREMQLTVDNDKTVGHSPGYQTELSAKSNIFVGGVPNSVHNGSLRGLTGCIEQIEFGSGAINIGETAVSSKNIVPCNSSEANEIDSDDLH